MTTHTVDAEAARRKAAEIAREVSQVCEDSRILFGAEAVLAIARENLAMIRKSSQCRVTEPSQHSG